MRLTVLGSSGTAPRVDNPASGYLIRSEQATIWLDAGPGTYMALLREVDAGDVDAVLISHMHPDHCSDLFALFHELTYIRRSAVTVPLIVPAGSIDRLRGFVGGDAGHAIFTAFDIHEAVPGDLLQFGDVAATVQAAHHTVPAFAYRLAGAGAALGYTGDTGPSEMVADHLAGVDVLLAEATLQDASEPYLFHMSARQAGELANAARVRRLLLTHIPPSVDPAISLVEAADSYTGRLGLATAGDTYIIEAASDQQKDA